MRTDTSNSRSQAGGRRARTRADGFTLMETVVAMLVLMIGLLGLATAVSFSLTVSNRGRSVTNTKLLISAVLEQMEMLRNTRQLTFGQISNTGAVDNTGAAQDFNGFPSTFEPVSTNPGPDGIYGTSDDMLDAGNDRVYGTADDYVNPGLARPGYTRQILITALSPTLKRIQVTLRAPGSAGDIKSLVSVSYLNDNAHSNFTP